MNEQLNSSQHKNELYSFRGVTGSNQPEKEMDTLSHKTMQQIMCYFWTTVGDDMAALWRIQDELAGLSILLGAKANTVIHFMRGKMAWHEWGNVWSTSPSMHNSTQIFGYRFEPLKFWYGVPHTRWWTPAPCPPSDPSLTMPWSLVRAWDFKAI